MSKNKSTCASCVSAFLKGKDSCPACSGTFEGVRPGTRALAEPPLTDTIRNVVIGEEDLLDLMSAERRSDLLFTWNDPLVLRIVFLAVFMGSLIALITS